MDLESYREELLLEAQLSASCIGSGLTALAHHDFASKGRFFAGLFGLTIGLERLLKLELVLDFALTNQTMPSNAYLKKHGHQLTDLFDTVRRINAHRSLGVDETAIRDPLVVRIIDILSRFATRSRYYNLDAITGGSALSPEEPLKEWSQQIGAEILKRHHRVTKTMIRDISFGKIVDRAGGVLVHHTADDGMEIGSVESLTRHAMEADTKQRYAVLYAYGVVSYGINILSKLDYLFRPILYLHEAFAYFYDQPRKAVLRRKRWEPYP